MSSLTITAAGELLQDKYFFETGKSRLKKFYEYTKFNGAFSEYNSSTYTLVAIHEITRMLSFFRDAECLDMARKLNCYAWEMVASHYNSSIGQLTPPQARAYRDVDDGSPAWHVWLGTGADMEKRRKDRSNYRERYRWKNCVLYRNVRRNVCLFLRKRIVFWHIPIIETTTYVRLGTG